MKTIKVYIVAPEELHIEYLEFADMISQLNKVFRTRGIEIDPTSDDLINDLSGLGEYQMCLVMYWNNHDKDSEMLLNTAYKELQEGNNPKKLYIYFKEPAENISEELAEFKASFATRYGHFYCKFENVDTLKLHFLLQFENIHKDLLYDTVTVENERVYVGRQFFADFNNIPFASLNENYKKMQSNLQNVCKEIEEKRIRLEESQKRFLDVNDSLPSLPENVHDLVLKATQDAVDAAKKEMDILEKKRVMIKEAFDKIQTDLLDTARLIVGMENRMTSERIHRAVETFNNGDALKARIILEEAEADLDTNFQNYQNMLQVTNTQRETLLLNIDEQLFRIYTIKTSQYFSSNSYLYDEKALKEVQTIYRKLLKIAQLVDEEKYIEILISCGTFYRSEYICMDNTEDPMQYYKQALQLQLSLAGEYNSTVAYIYNQMGCYYSSRDECLALKYFVENIRIREKIEPTDSRSLAISYLNVANLSYAVDDYDNAMHCYEKYLSIAESYKDKYSLIDTYFNLAHSYLLMRDDEKALKYFNKTIECETKYNKQTIELALQYSGDIYCKLRKYGKAASAYKKALKLYNNIRLYRILISFYENQKKYYQAAQYCLDAIKRIELKYDEDAESKIIEFEDKANTLSEHIQIEAIKLKDKGNIAKAEQHESMDEELRTKPYLCHKKWDAIQCENKIAELRSSINSGKVENNVLLAHALCDLADVYSIIGEYGHVMEEYTDRIVEEYEEAFSIYNNLIQSEPMKHCDQWLKITHCLSNVYMRIGQYAKGLDMYVKVFELCYSFVKEYNWQGVTLFLELERLADYYCKTENFNKAEQLYSEVIDMLHKKQEERVRSVANDKQRERVKDFFEHQIAKRVVKLSNLYHIEGGISHNN